MILNREDEYFINKIIDKLLPLDIIILNSLKEHTIPQLGKTREELKKESNKSEYNILVAVNRLELVCLINSLKVGRTSQYAISPMGERVLEILENV